LTGIHYKEHKKFLVAVDCIIFGFDEEGLKLLLIKRKFEPCKGQWSLMGGFVMEGENVDDSAKRVLYDLTGLSNIYLEQLYTYGDVNRDPAGRVISIAYFALIKTDDYDSTLGEQHGARWVNIIDKPHLIFDHDIMVEKALARLKRRVRNQPIGFELLPEKFTLPLLQKLYEAIYQEEFDKRNFRRRLLTMDLLIKLNEKDKINSKKGAFKYMFDKNRYDELVSTGFYFEVK
jgi:8-oxo-dGTP diphosphatase